ncbi:hypothetical protein EV368DRAFT_70378 [Lentinula lateritia]|nr:hypothetical protein EV368DRAFT_70378 [Lentinula lateritia]
MNKLQLHHYFQQLHANTTYLGHHDSSLPGPGSFFYSDSMHVWSHPLQPGHEKLLPMVLHVVGRISNQGNFTSLSGSLNVLLNSTSGADKLRVKSMWRTALLDWEPALMKIKQLQKILTRTEGEPTRYLWFNEGGGVADTYMKIGTPCFHACTYGEGCDGRLTDLIPAKERTNPRWVDALQNLAVANFNAVDHTGAPLPEGLLPQILNGATIDVAFTLRGWKFGRDTLWGFTADIKQYESPMAAQDTTGNITHLLTQLLLTTWIDHTMLSRCATIDSRMPAGSKLLKQRHTDQCDQPIPCVECYRRGWSWNCDNVGVGPMYTQQRPCYNNVIGVESRDYTFQYPAPVGAPQLMQPFGFTATNQNLDPAPALGPPFVPSTDPLGNRSNDRLLLQEADYMSAMSKPTGIDEGNTASPLSYVLAPNFDWSDPNDDTTMLNTINVAGKHHPSKILPDSAFTVSQESSDNDKGTTDITDSNNVPAKGKKRVASEDLAVHSTPAKSAKVDNSRGPSAN